MVDTSRPETITILKDEWEAMTLWYDFTSEFIESLPTGMSDLFGDDWRYKEWLNLMNSGWDVDEA